MSRRALASTMLRTCRPMKKKVRARYAMGVGCVSNAAASNAAIAVFEAAVTGGSITR